MMSSIHIVYKRRKNKLFTICCAGVLGTFIAVMAIGFIGIDDNALPFGLNATYFLTKSDVMIDKDSYKSQNMDYQNGFGAVTMPGSGGLNTTLIAQMMEGYCKDYLTICLEGAEGRLEDQTDWKIPMEASLSVAAAEGSGFYNGLGDGRTVPLSDLPESKVKNYTSGSLKTWGTKEHNNYGGVSEKGGPFQYISGSTLTPLQIKSKYSPSSTKNGDMYNVPDCIASMAQFMRNNEKNSALGDYLVEHQDSISPEVRAAIIMNSHNRGGGGPAYFAHGLRYNTGYSTIKDNNNCEYIVKQFQTICNDLTKDFSSVNAVDAFNLILSDSQSKCITWPVLVHNGWYIEHHQYKEAGKYDSRVKTSMELWNLLYPSEAFSSISEYRAYLEKNYVRDAYEILTDGDISLCDKLFNTENGRYGGFPNGSTHGSLFKPIKNTDDVYKLKTDYAAISLEEIAAQHLLICLTSSRVIFAKMLAFSGVTVDPTNPETYTNTIVQASVTVDTPQWTADAPTWLANFGVKDTSTFGPARIALLNAAYEVAFKSDGSPRVGYSQTYKKNYSDSIRLEDLSYLDCSSYVSWCYGYAQRKYGYNLHPKDFPAYTAGYSPPRKYLKFLDAEDAKAGDIGVKMNGSSDSHAVIFLSKIDGNHLNAMECSRGSTRISIKSYTILPASNTDLVDSRGKQLFQGQKVHLFRYMENGVTDIDQMQVHN
ncbi:hypothetical protein AALB53_08455 [Lachnospiraceae bacterium 47-T17]